MRAAVLTCLAVLLETTLAGKFNKPNKPTTPPLTTAPPTSEATPGGGCETAWAKIADGGVCFIGTDVTANRWGWNNYIDIADGGSTALQLWAAAGGCVLGNGQHVGQLDVSRSGGDVTACYVPLSGTAFTEFHLYIGAAQWYTHPNNGKQTVAPGQFPYGQTDSCYTVAVGTSPFYVQAHTVACGVPSTPIPDEHTPTPISDFTPAPVFTIPPVSLETGFTNPPSAPGCPIQMFSNGSTGSGADAFLDECGCGEFTCDSPTSPWSSRDYRFCGSCPEYLNGAYHFSCPHCAASGTDLSFACPNDWEACDVFISVYSNCATGNTDGGLAYNLASEGWQPGSCGPSFCLNFNDTCQSPGSNAVTQVDDTNIRFKMVMFHKQAAGGDQISIPQLASDPTMYLTFFVKQGRFCSNDKNQTQCLEQPGVCKWDAGRADSCYAEICPPIPPPPPGNRPCCDIAPGVEAGECSAPSAAITSVCDFNLPQC